MLLYCEDKNAFVCFHKLIIHMMLGESYLIIVFFMGKEMSFQHLSLGKIYAENLLSSIYATRNFPFCWNMCVNDVKDESHKYWHS